MFTPQVIEQGLSPISEAAPSGTDLEYDPDYLALQSAALGKPEQQFGDTVIAATEPDWPAVLEQGMALCQRSKDLRVAMLVLRAATRLQHVEGARLGLQWLNGLIERFWDSIHPALDPDDDLDPTMRFNALAGLNDEATFLRDLYGARIGISRGAGPIAVRDVLVARNALAPVGEAGLSTAAVMGGFEEILREDAAVADHLRALPQLAARLDEQIATRSGQTSFDLSRLHAVLRHLQQAAEAVAPAPDAPDTPAPTDGSAPGVPQAAAPGTDAPRFGEIRNRQDAIATLDRVIHYLQQAEPGHPAPLLIERAKKLIGVSFLEIMANLAPGALDTIETITGQRPQE